MSVIRSCKKSQFSSISNEVPQNPELSAKAKGIHTYMMTLPDGWVLRKPYLIEQFRDGKESFEAGWSELVDFGYIVRKPKRKVDGTVRGWDFDVYETLAEAKDATKKPRKKKAETVIPQNLLDLSKSFMEEQKENFPNLVKITDTKITKGAEILSMLIRVDKHSLEDDIIPALDFVISDDFWCRNLLSLASLRKKGSNGELKFINILTAQERGRGRQKEQDTTVAPTETEHKRIVGAEI